MKTWLLSYWDSLRGSFWFLPLLMVAGAFGLSWATLAVDRAAVQHDWEMTFAWTFARGPEGSRALLATVAGSMITIASVTFSITVVALQQASSQFGPRLLHNFMRDRGNQVVLGTFIAAFTYCLLVLRTVNGTEDHQFVPRFSVTVGLALALAGVGVLIYFIHHAAKSLQAEHVIAGVSGDLHEAIGRLFPSSLGAGGPRPAGAEGAGALPDGFEAESRPSPRRSASTSRSSTATCCCAWPPSTTSSCASSAARGSSSCGAPPSHRLAGGPGPRRTRSRPGGGVLFRRPADPTPGRGVRHRPARRDRPACPLSGHQRPLYRHELRRPPRCRAGRIGRKAFPSPYRYDDEKRLRVVAAPATAAGITDAAFHQVRQAARTNAAVTLRLLETLAAVGSQTRDAPLRAALLRHAALIHEESQGGLPAESDRAEARSRYEALLRVFEGDPR